MSKFSIVIQLLKFQLNGIHRPYGDWLDFVLKQDKIPLTISTSYGDDEETGMQIAAISDYMRHLRRESVPESYARRICAQFAQLGARGVSVLFSSGDAGVGDGIWDPHYPTTCISNDGKNTTKFLPSFPARYACPILGKKSRYSLFPCIILQLSLVRIICL